MIHIKRGLTQFANPSQDQVRPVFWVFGELWQFGGNQAQITKIMDWETRKIIQSLQFHISVTYNEAIPKSHDHRGLSYTFLREHQVHQGQFRETGPKLPKSKTEITPHFTSKEVYSVIMVMLGFSCAYLRVFVALGQFWKTGSQCP